MRDNKNISAIAQAGLMVAITALLMTVTIYIPVFNFFSYFLIGMPLAVLVAKQNRIIAVCAGVIAFVVTFVLTGRFAGVAGLMILGVIPGAVCGYFVKHKYSYIKCILITAGVFAVGVIVLLIAFKFFLKDAGIVQVMGKLMDDVKASLYETFESLMTRSDLITDTDKLKNIFKSFENALILSVPSFVVIVSCIYGFITTYCCRLVFVKLRIETRYITKFYMLRVKKSTCYIAVISYFLSGIVGEGIFAVVFANMSTLLYLVVGIGGFSLLDYYLKDQIKQGYLRWAVYVSFFMMFGVFFGFVFNFLIAAGFLDSIFDFRKMKKDGGCNAK